MWLYGMKIIVTSCKAALRKVLYKIIWHDLTIDCWQFIQNISSDITNTSWILLCIRHIVSYILCIQWILCIFLSSSGDGDESWKIAHVTLNVEEKFRYFFQGIVGSNKTIGGIFIDDITLTETSCPNAVWRIQNFTNLLNNLPHGERVQSRRFYNFEGYAYGINVYPNGRVNSSKEFVGITFHLFAGENDAVLEWPAENRQITITFMDQNTDTTLQMSNSRSFTTGESVYLSICPSVRLISFCST